MELKGKEVFIAKEEKWEDLGEGVSRQITGFNPSLMMVKVKFEKGAIGYAHQHFHSQASFVSKGKFELTIDGDKSIIEEGDCFFVTPNKNHGVQCLEEGMLVDIFNPLREDFLK